MPKAFARTDELPILGQRPIAKTAPNPAVTRDRLGSGSERVQCMGNENSYAQNNQKCGDSFKHRRILRNRRIERSIFCTVKEIPPTNFPPHDDFEQHSAQRETKNGSTALLSFWETISCPHANLNHHGRRRPPGRRHHHHPARPSRRVNPNRAGNSPTFTSLIMRRWNGRREGVNDED
jgi:hypothetical protein